MNKVFDKGEVYTVIVTPFDEEDKIIYSDFDNLINYQIKNGVNGIILLGTTSESPTIDSEEQQEIVDYVWNRFENAFFSAETIKLNKQIFKITAAHKHRPFNSSSDEHQLFLNMQLDNIKGIKMKNPIINFDKEIGLFKKQLINPTL